MSFAEELIWSIKLFYTFGVNAQVWNYFFVQIIKGLPFPANPWYLSRAIRDDFKTCCRNLVQEMGGQIDGVLAAWFCLESTGFVFGRQVTFSDPGNQKSTNLKYSLVETAIFFDNNNNASKLGNAMRPFMISETSQTGRSSDTAPTKMKMQNNSR